MVLGVDGGNTKTIALAATSDGAVIGSGRAGCSDIYSWPRPDSAIDQVVAAAETALAEAGVARSAVRAAVFSLAGADWPEDFQLLHRALGGWLGRDPAIVNDAIGAIHCGIPSGVGVAVVCGTWSAVGARGEDGALFHIGFWPDSSGATLLGRDALDAVYREGLGIGPATALTRAALERYAVDSPLELMHLFTRRARTAPPSPASFARVMLDVSAAGDPVARAIVSGHAENLAAQARASAARVSLARPYPLVLAGPVFRHGGELAQLVMDAQPEAEWVPARLEPAAAAVWAALRTIGAREDAYDTLMATVPGPELFATETA